MRDPPLAGAACEEMLERHRVRRREIETDDPRLW